MSSPAERYFPARRRAASSVLTDFAAGYGFPLDDFQAQACRALEAGEGVLVAAPNGAAPVVVMTTEVLRNMLYGGSPALRGLGYVVMDEVHYLSDRFRGAVWEEVIIHLPESVRLVSLSATVSNTEEFADWLVTVRGHTTVIVEEHRPVPLWQHVLAGNRLYDLFVDEEHKAVNPELVRFGRDHARIQRQLDRHGRPGRPRSRGSRGSGVPSRVEVIERLDAEGLLPAITFVFSRVGGDAAEDERDRRQQPLGVQPLDHLHPAGDARAARAARPGPPRSAVAVQLALDPGVIATEPDELRVDRLVLLVDEQVVEPVAGQYVLPQRHRSVLLDDHGGVAADGDQPVGELLGVGHGGRQRHQPHRLGQVDDHLFPDRTAEPIGQVVHLIHDHVAQAAQRGRAAVEHVAQHLGGHYHHRGGAVDRVVAGQQSDRRLAVAGDQVGVLLVRQRLDRRGVEALAAVAQRQVHGELADDGLAGAGGGGDQDALPRLQRPTGLRLEVVQREAVAGGEIG